MIREGKVVGRIYRMKSIGSETWMWTQSGMRAPTHRPNGGVADSLDEAPRRLSEGRGMRLYERAMPLGFIEPCLPSKATSRPPAARGCMRSRSTATG